MLILAGWWFVRNYFLYDGDILGLKTQDQYAEHYAMDILKPSNRRTYQNQGYSMVYMLFRSDWAASVLKSFIGVLGPLWYALRWWMYVGYACCLSPESWVCCSSARQNSADGRRASV